MLLRASDLEIHGQFKHYPKSVATSETILYTAEVRDQSQSNG